jgi:hypothetical protein
MEDVSKIERKRAKECIGGVLMSCNCGKVLIVVAQSTKEK